MQLKSYSGWQKENSKWTVLRFKGEEIRELIIKDLDLFPIEMTVIASDKLGIRKGQ